MRCLYREKRYYCGDYLEVDIFPVFGTTKARRKKYKPTKEAQKRLNAVHAQRKLIRLLNTNFTPRDIRFDLTYSPENTPESVEDAQRQVTNFLRRVKRYREKHGLPKLKYVAVTEMGKKRGRIHHHIVMTGGVELSILVALWGRGYTSAKALQFDDCGLANMAVYLTKEQTPVTRKRWCASKNLEKPVVTERTGKLTKAEAEEICRCGKTGAIEQLYPEYRISEWSAEENDVNAGYYIRLTMHKRAKKTKRQGRRE